MTTLTRGGLAKLVARHLPQEGFVNLGIGAPTHIADFLPTDTSVILHSENGILNIGPKPPVGQEDYDLINAGKSPITIGIGGAFFDSSLAFAMMRGGHLDVAVLGAFEVSEKGDIANWSTGRKDGAPPAIGGAIDLAVGAKEIWVMMEHVTKEGAPRLVKQCSCPLTAAGVVKRIFTNLAVIRVEKEGLIVEAIVEGLSLHELQLKTSATLVLDAEVSNIDAERINAEVGV